MFYVGKLNLRPAQLSSQITPYVAIYIRLCPISTNYAKKETCLLVKLLDPLACIKYIIYV